MVRALFVAMLLCAACSRARDAPAEVAKAAEPAPAALSCRALEGCTDACADAACAEACVRRLTTAARPAYAALQACVTPACANADGGAAPCRVPSSFACKMCVLSSCARQASACMTH